MAIFGKKVTADNQAAKSEDVVTASDKTVEFKIPSEPIAAKVLKHPRISEKVGRLTTLNKYVFNVKDSANKVEIRKAIEAVYKVKVTGVNILNTKGKLRNYGRTKGKTSGFKKAIITLKKGDRIEGLTDVV